MCIPALPAAACLGRARGVLWGGGEAAGRCRESGGQVKRFELALCSTTLRDAAVPELGATGGAGMTARVLGLMARGLITVRGGKRHRLGQPKSQGGWGAPSRAGASPKHSGSCRHCWMPSQRCSPHPPHSRGPCFQGGDDSCAWSGPLANLPLLRDVVRAQV